MKKLIIFSFFAILSHFGFSQDYSYSFNGKIDSDQINLIEQRCSELPEVTSAKLKYKLESEKGEIIIHVEPIKAFGEARQEFSAADFKKILQSFGLTPLDFIELGTK